MMPENCSVGKIQYRIYHFIIGSTGFSPVSMENVLNESGVETETTGTQRQQWCEIRWVFLFIKIKIVE